MTDPRSRLRPLLHCGVAFKVRAAIDEILASADPELVEWALEAAYIADLAMSEYWQWKHDDVVEVRHPSLEPEQALRLVSGASSPRAAKLCAKLGKLGIELGFNRRDEPFLDCSMLGGLPATHKLRLMPLDPQNGWEWRAELGPPKPLLGFPSIRGMTELAHLTIIGGADLDLAALVPLAKLRHLELVGCTVIDPSPLGELAVTTIALRACPSITALPAMKVEVLQIEHLPQLASIGRITAKVAELSGTPLLARPAGATLFHAERQPRTSF